MEREGSTGPEWEMERGGIQISILSSQKEKPMPATHKRGKDGDGGGGVVQKTSLVQQTEVQGKGELGMVLGRGEMHPSSSNSGEEDQDTLEVAESPRGCPICPAVGERRGGKTGRYQDYF